MKKKWNKWFVTFFLGVLICILGACANPFAPDELLEQETTEDPGEGLIVVGVSQVGSESIWRTAHTASIQEALTTENGYYMIYDNARQKQENQIKAIRNFISQQVDYIVLSPITETGWDTVLQEAKDAGIPVILMDRMVDVEDESLYAAWIGSDFEEEGKKAGYWLQEYLEKKEPDEEAVRIVVLLGTEGSTSVIGRSKGFEYVAAKNPNWEILEQVDADFTMAKGYEVMKHLLEKYPDIDVVVSQNDDMTFGALEAMDEAGVTTGKDGDVILISFDAVKTALEKVGEGTINVDIECNPLQGLYIDMIIKNLESGVPIEKKYYTVERIFTPENVGLVLDDRLY